MPVGPGLLGRVVDPLGRPLDDKGAITAASREPIERAAPAIIDRDLVTEPVQTGLLVIDAMFALGRGQRELIIGDRAIGKTAVAIDCMINQKSSDIICVYVAIGQKTSAIRRVIDAVTEFGAPERCVFVAASASAPPGLQWIAPFAGLHHRRIFPRPRPARPARHRRPQQARRHPSRDRAAVAPAARPRGLSRRRLLRACPAAGARRQARQGARQRLADRASHRRDRRRQPQRLHPDQPHLDHRRPDRARRAAVPGGPRPGDRHRQERQPRRRQDPGARPARGAASRSASTTPSSSSWRCSPASAA